MGVVVRDDAGSVVGALAKSYPCLMEAEAAEAVRAWEAVSLCGFQHWDCLVF